MLSDKIIDEWVQRIENRQSDINLEILVLIAKRIREFRTVKPSDVYALERMLKTGADVRAINRKLAELAAIQESDIKQLIRAIAASAYIDTKPYFDYRQRPFIPFEENKPLQRVVRSIANTTAGRCRNLSNSTAFMLRDPRNPKILKSTTLSNAYQQVVDKAIQVTQSGVVDYTTAMKQTVQDLVESGIRVAEYTSESGKKTYQSIEAAVRRNVLDGVRAINQGVQDIVGQQFGADGKEVTVHAYPAPDHEYIQGHMFSDEEFEKLQNDQAFEDVKGKRYRAVKRAIGQWNCRHFTFSIIVGFSTPVHTEEELQKIIDANHKGYTDSKGRHRTMYECTQHQREFERKIRKNKQGVITAQEAGDTQLAKQYQAKVNELNREYKMFSKSCGLPTMPTKTRVPGYTRIAV